MSDTIPEDAVQPEESNEEIFHREPMDESPEGTHFDYEDGNVEESTQEVVEESVEETPTNETPVEETISDVPHKEDPSRFEYWQSKFSKEQQARKELEERFQSLEGKLEQPNTPEPEPLQPPVKPNSDDPLDKIEYLEKLAEYNQNILINQQEAFDKQLETQRQAQEQAQFKAYALGEYQKAGADEKLSQEAFNFFSSEDSLNLATQIEMYQAWKQGVSQTNPKVAQVQKKMAQQQVPLPPGVGGGETEVPQEMDFGEELLAFTNK